eukprot:Platyproteum_vivax@DN4953_c0_g1_i1.p1
MKMGSLDTLEKIEPVALTSIIKKSSVRFKTKRNNSWQQRQALLVHRKAMPSDEKELLPVHCHTVLLFLDNPAQILQENWMETVVEQYLVDGTCVVESQPNTKENILVFACPKGTVLCGFSSAAEKSAWISTFSKAIEKCRRQWLLNSETTAMQKCTTTNLIRHSVNNSVSVSILTPQKKTPSSAQRPYYTALSHRSSERKGTFSLCGKKNIQPLGRQYCSWIYDARHSQWQPQTHRPSVDSHCTFVPLSAREMPIRKLQFSMQEEFPKNKGMLEKEAVEDDDSSDSSDLSICGLLCDSGDTGDTVETVETGETGETGETAGSCETVEPHNESDLDFEASPQQVVRPKIIYKEVGLSSVLGSNHFKNLMDDTMQDSPLFAESFQSSCK